MIYKDKKARIMAGANAKQLTDMANQLSDFTVKVAGVNLFDSSTSQDGYYADQNSGVQNGNVGFTMGVFMSIKPSTIYSQWNNSTSTTSPVVFYDTNKAYISGYYNSGTNIFTSPVNAYYCRISPSIAQKNTIIFKEGASASAFVAYGYKTQIKATSNDVLWGKTLATAGDSITFGAQIGIDATTGIRMTYGGIVATNHNMTFYNYGLSGSTLSNVSGKAPFVVSRYQSMVANLDYLTIFFGWNDDAYSTLGTIADTVDTTYLGAYNIVLTWLIANYPKTKIGLIVPYGCTTAMRQGVRDIAKKYGLKCLDLYDENVPLFFGRETGSTVLASIVTARRATFLADGVHPNIDGYAFLATIYEDFLRSL